VTEVQGCCWVPVSTPRLFDLASGQVGRSFGSGNGVSRSSRPSRGKRPPLPAYPHTTPGAERPARAWNPVGSVGRQRRLWELQLGVVGTAELEAALGHEPGELAP
jgi:hypothetical protein